MLGEQHSTEMLANVSALIAGGVRSPAKSALASVKAYLAGNALYLLLMMKHFQFQNDFFFFKSRAHIPSHFESVLRDASSLYP